MNVTFFLIENHNQDFKEEKVKNWYFGVQHMGTWEPNGNQEFSFGRHEPCSLKCKAAIAILCLQCLNLLEFSCLRTENKAPGGQLHYLEVGHHVTEHVSNCCFRRGAYFAQRVFKYYFSFCISVRMSYTWLCTFAVLLLAVFIWTSSCLPMSG